MFREEDTLLAGSKNGNAPTIVSSKLLELITALKVENAKYTNTVNRLVAFDYFEQQYVSYELIKPVEKSTLYELRSMM